MGMQLKRKYTIENAFQFTASLSLLHRGCSFQREIARRQYSHIDEFIMSVVIYVFDN